MLLKWYFVIYMERKNLFLYRLILLKQLNQKIFYMRVKYYC